MAQITIYHDADVTVTVNEGSPPDVTALNQQITDLTAEKNALQAKIDAAIAAAQADKAADAANVAGQGVLDALA